MATLSGNRSWRTWGIGVGVATALCITYNILWYSYENIISGPLVLKIESNAAIGLSEIIGIVTGVELSSKTSTQYAYMWAGREKCVFAKLIISNMAVDEFANAFIGPDWKTHETSSNKAPPNMWPTEEWVIHSEDRIKYIFTRRDMACTVMICSDGSMKLGVWLNDSEVHARLSEMFYSQGVRVALPSCAKIRSCSKMPQRMLNNRPPIEARCSSFAVGREPGLRSSSPHGRVAVRCSPSARSESLVDRHANCPYRRSSGCLTAVALQQPAEPLLTADFTQRHNLFVKRSVIALGPTPLLLPLEELIVDSGSLMGLDLFQGQPVWATWRELPEKMRQEAQALLTRLISQYLEYRQQIGGEQKVRDER